MSASIASPDFVFSRYFLSQMSAEAGCIGISCAALSILTASRRTVLMLLHLLVVAGSCPVLIVLSGGDRVAPVPRKQAGNATPWAYPSPPSNAGFPLTQPGFRSRYRLCSWMGQKVRGTQHSGPSVAATTICCGNGRRNYAPAAECVN